MFDTGASHSFASQEFVRKNNINVIEVRRAFAVNTPTGGKVVTRTIVKDGVIEIQGRGFPINLIVLPLSRYDVILGIDWLSKYNANIDCRRKHISFLNGKIIFYGSMTRSKSMRLTAMKLSDEVDDDWHYYWVYVMEGDKEIPKLSDIPIVYGFLNVFPEDLPGLAPHREVDFSIELTPGTEPISKALSSLDFTKRLYSV